MFRSISGAPVKDDAKEVPTMVTEPDAPAAYKSNVPTEPTTGVDEFVRIMPRCNCVPVALVSLNCKFVCPDATDFVKNGLEFLKQRAEAVQQRIT